MADLIDIYTYGYDKHLIKTSEYPILPTEEDTGSSLPSGVVAGTTSALGSTIPLTPSEVGTYIPDSGLDYKKLNLSKLDPNEDIGTSNFVVGTSGWRIEGDGDAYFNSIFASVGGTIGGWIINSTSLYKLASGTPSVNPTDGVVLNSGTTPSLIVYEDAAIRVRVGYLSSGIFGILGYATDGTTKLFELSDTQNLIAGWTISETTLANSTNIILDASNKAISINSATWQNQGIQLQYNAGTPRAYIGDGGVTAADYYIMFDGTNIAWNAVATSLSTTGHLDTTSATVGGWEVVDGYIYNLQSGTPTVNPSDGIVLASGNEALIVYEDTAKRCELGYLSAGIYGIKIYDGAGTGTLMEVSDTQSIIAGWTISTTTLANSTNIILDASNKAISLNNATFGNDGIQLQYNAGNPRAYIGDGANYFFSFDGTNISWGAVATTLSTAGLLTTTSALIGGWNVVDGYIYNLQSGTPTVAPSDGIVIASGNEGIIVYEDTEKRVELGYLSAGVYGLKGYATNGTDVTFELSDTQQRIAGWYFTNTLLRSNTTDATSNILIDSANGLIRAGVTAGNYITIDGANLRIRSSNYVSGFAGAGFTLEPDLLEVGNIACRGLLRTYVLQKSILSVNAGNLLVAPNADVLDADMTALDASTLTIKGTVTFAVNDRLCIKDGTDMEWLLVTNIASAPTYTVTRDQAGAYGADANPAWKKGATVANYGQSGAGGLYLTASDTNAPYMSVYTHAGSPWATLTTQLRLGNLNGYLDYVADIYGFACGSSSGTNANVTIDPTNGVRIRNGTTNVMTLDNLGNATFVGSITANAGYIGGTSGWVITTNYIKDVAGVTGLSSVVTVGDDIRIWAGHATPASAPFYVTESGALVATSATISGSITATSGTIGGWVVTATQLADAAGVVGMSSAVTGGDDIRFWAGDATPANAEFKVTEAGVLTASSATITGTIYATAGYFVNALTIGNGVSASGTLTLSHFDTGGDTYIAGGTITAAAWTAQNGFIIGIDDSDSDKFKAYFGDSTANYFWDWNVSTANTFTVSGVLKNNNVFTAGEAITAGKAVYLKAADSKVYLTSSSDYTTSETFCGFAPSNINNGATGQIQNENIFTGLSGLTVGQRYRLAFAGSSESDINYAGDGNVSGGLTGQRGESVFDSCGFTIAFSVTNPTKLTSVTLSIRKQGNPGDTIAVEIIKGGMLTGARFYTPSTRAIAGKASELAGGTITADFADYVFDFGGMILRPGSYGIAIYRTGATDIVNYYQFQRSASGSNYYTHAIGTWSDAGVKLRYAINFVNETFVAGDITDYFYTNRVDVGLALSATSLLIDKPPLRTYRTTGQTTGGGTLDVPSTGYATITPGFLPRIIKVTGLCSLNSTSTTYWGEYDVDAGTWKGFFNDGVDFYVGGNVLGTEDAGANCNVGISIGDLTETSFKIWVYAVSYAGANISNITSMDVYCIR